MEQEMIITVTKAFEFSYAHYLPGYDGRCKNLHGHNAKVLVTFRGKRTPGGPKKGMVVDFGEIKKEVGYLIDRKYDHKLLNDMVCFSHDDLVTNPPTAENIALVLFDQIATHTNLGNMLYKVRVYETDDSYAEVKTTKAWRR